MPKVTQKPTDERCPECPGRLTLIAEEWDPFPDEGESKSTVNYKKCDCGYSFMIGSLGPMNVAEWKPGLETHGRFYQPPVRTGIAQVA